MSHENTFWKLDALSDRQVLDGLNTVLASGRRALAQLLAHLGEVEERRLHLQAACSSLFSYCVTRLGLSEDEACRRIEVARLARRFPLLFPALATGSLSLSVAALLKPTLSAENAVDLVAAVSGKSVQQARELLAARFPLPDVESRVRKLPERRATPQPVLAFESPKADGSSAAAPPGAPALGSQCAGNTVVFETPATPPVSAGPAVQPRAPARAARIEPLSAARYKVQFSAGTELKRKLELARNLMRHVHPNGDFEPIIERALDLLIAQLMNRRFGVTTRPKTTRSKPRDPSEVATTFQPATSQPTSSQPGGLSERPPSEVPAPSHSTGSQAAAEPSPARSSHIARATRRSLLQRDSLRCSWTDQHGERCGEQAWLEFDHRHPRARGGGSELGNVRLLCRSHNRLAAEQSFGRRHVERAIRARRQRARVPKP